MSDSQPKMDNPLRGRKACKECGVINGVRAYVCKHCGEEFKMKKARRRAHKVPVKDFKTLQEGDLIRVVGGSGPYYTSKETGERTYLVDRGKYIVVEVDRSGVHVNGSNGSSYLYMGKTCPSDLLDSITKSACKLQKVYQPN